MCSRLFNFNKSLELCQLKKISGSLFTDDPHLKACVSAYYEVLGDGTSLSDPNLNGVS